MEYVKAAIFSNQNICFGPVMITSLLVQADYTANEPVRIIAEGRTPGKYRELYFRSFRRGEYVGDWFLWAVDPDDNDDEKPHPRTLTCLGSHAVFRDQYFYSHGEIELPLHHITLLTTEERARLDQLIPG